MRPPAPKSGSFWIITPIGSPPDCISEKHKRDRLHQHAALPPFRGRYRAESSPGIQSGATGPTTLEHTEVFGISGLIVYLSILRRFAG